VQRPIHRPHFFRCLFVSFLWCWLAVGLPHDVEAQSTDRPRLYLETQGPAGLVWKLAFSTDSPTTALFAAGEDKAVHVWHLSENAGATGKAATFVKTMRWEFSRGPRGAIYDMDVTRSGQFPLLAIGGYGAREGLNAAVFNLERGELAPHLANGIDGASLAVDSVSFSPDGTRIAVVDKGQNFARVRLWSPPGQYGIQDLWPPPQELTRFDSSEFDKSVKLTARFLSNRWLAVPDFPTRAAKGTDPRPTGIRLFDVSAAKPSTAAVNLPSIHKDRITAIGVAPDGKTWASAGSRGSILIHDNPGAGRVVGNLRPRVVRADADRQRVAASLAFSPDGARLLVGNLLDFRDQTVAEIWNLQSSPPALVESTELSGKEDRFVHNPSVAWSPDGRWIALYQPADQKIHLYDASIPGAMVFGKRPETIMGRGSAVRRVAFSADDPLVVGYSTAADAGSDRRAAPNHTFDLAARKSTSDLDASTAQQWRTGETDSKGWTVEPPKNSPPPHLSMRVSREPLSTTLSFDPTQHGYYKSHCWVSDKSGEPAAIAIGTSFGNGVYVYRLPKKEDELPVLLRNFRDHNGSVNAISVSRDQRMLATASEDQTIKIWSLDGLVDGSAQRSGWGADLRRSAEGRVVLQRVVSAGILASRGFEEGDEIAALKFGGQVEQNADRILARFPLERLELGQVTIVGRRNGKPLGEINVYPGWEPLATLFVDRVRPEWALFSPEGYYASSDFEGADLFGWLSNDGERNPPRTLTATSLRSRFEQPNVLGELFLVGSLKAALQASGVAAPAGRLAASVQSVPLISPLGPTLLEAVPATALPKIEAQIRLPAGALWNQYRASLSINSAVIDPGDVSAVPVAGKDGRTTVFLALNEAPQKPIRRQPGLSLVKFRVESADDVEKSERITTEVQTAFRDSIAGVADKPYPVYFLGVGANAYQGTKNKRPATTAWEPLQHAENDARDIDAAIRALDAAPQSPLKRQKASELVVGKEITRAGVVGAIDRLNKSIRSAPLDPQALVIVFLSGHGDVKDDEFYFVTPECRDSLDLSAKGVRWSDFEPLMTLPCQKLFLIDACRSGTIGSLKGTIEAMNRHSCLFITAATSEANSFEDPKFPNGIFTHVLRRGLQGLATEEYPTPPQNLGTPHGHVTLGNLYSFLVDAVQERARQINRKQVPYGFPHEQLRLNPRPLFVTK
jgi:WD40 repeat protein